MNLGGTSESTQRRSLTRGKRVKRTSRDEEAGGREDRTRGPAGLLGRPLGFCKSASTAACLQPPRTHGPGFCEEAEPSGRQSGSPSPRPLLFRPSGPTEDSSFPPHEDSLGRLLACHVAHEAVEALRREPASLEKISNIHSGKGALSRPPHRRT